MTRSELLSAIQAAERESEAAARALGVLRRMVESILQINGDIEGPTANGEMTRHLSDLAHSPKPVLKAWAVACCHDPLLEQLIAARKKYARADRMRGKGTRDLEVAVNLTYQSATAAGFKGSRNQWEALLRMRG